MTSERSQAYGRVVQTLENMGPAKLQRIEQERIRDAADALLFTNSIDASAQKALDDVEALASHLVDAGRWADETARKLVDDVAGCGPVPALA